ncbi:hypothetical protein PVL29_024268 [Vitis rotundifolia]|uniref:Transmembrane 9 superfamily member n=1 Tax=Vitis rotundifolia TaxID=103349 RepID=A0AA38YRF1_VITRO|nr:hypothetical protein PVL29_024268 [Vitis rotundifolia]
MNEKLYVWKLVVGDVFRELDCLNMVVVTIVFATLGFMSPASRGMLLIGMTILYLFLRIFAGYVGVRLWKTIKGTSEGWRLVS